MELQTNVRSRMQTSESLHPKYFDDVTIVFYDTAAEVQIVAHSSFAHDGFFFETKPVQRLRLPADCCTREVRVILWELWAFQHRYEWDILRY